MNDDIVERLRALLRCRCEPDAACCETCSAVDAIADEIERLRARLAELEQGNAELWRKYADVIEVNAELGTKVIELQIEAAAEIERLRTRLAEAQEQAKADRLVVEEAYRNEKEAKARLAKAETLLLEWLDPAPDGIGRTELRRQTCAALMGQHLEDI